jgi:hypothetical protein
LTSVPTSLSWRKATGHNLAFFFRTASCFLIAFAFPWHASDIKLKFRNASLAIRISTNVRKKYICLGV